MTESKDFLIEIGTEELPPNALEALSIAFEQGIQHGLAELGFTQLNSQRFATPRRLAVLVNAVPMQQAEQQVERKGPAVNAAFDKDGNPTKAAEGFAKSCNVTVAQLERLETDKGAWLYHKATKAGVVTRTQLPTIVNQALAKLPIPKRMRWGANTVEFVRPVHWALMLFGEETIEAEILGVNSGKRTYGHRFHAPEPISIESPSQYSQLLFEKGKVIADFTQRREKVIQLVTALAEKLQRDLQIETDDALFNEVTALVEWPVVIACSFDKHFLSVPSEALVSTMKTNQKYFPTYNKDGSLAADFIVISNLESPEPDKIREGNERVVRPRLADAAFFWEQDKKHNLSYYNEQLKNVIFQKKLGSVYDKVNRVAALASATASAIHADPQDAAKAAQFCKADLMTAMVGEFPKLQGIMGRHYALHAGESENIAHAIEQHYWPRYSGDTLPTNNIAQCVAIADKLDTIIGILAVGLKPTGDKDPFALRRAALGVIKIIIEKQLPLDIPKLLNMAAAQFAAEINAQAVIETAFEFIMTRLRVEYETQLNFTPQQVDAVMALQPGEPLEFDRRIKAVSAFSKLSEATALAAANKRIVNILKKNQEPLLKDIDKNLLTDEAEQQLYDALCSSISTIKPMLANHEYESALQQLATLRGRVDNFFDNVLVMAEDKALRINRLSLLQQLHATFKQIADVACLQQ